MRRWHALAILCLLFAIVVLWTFVSRGSDVSVSSPSSSSSSSGSSFSSAEVRRRRRPALRVRVVEEHHEVVPHWESVDRFSVLHVDAHEDTAAPSVVDPRGAMRASMSANDVFVLSSLMRGKLVSFTWLWPSWDVLGPRHKKLHEHEYIEGRLDTIANSGVFLSKAGAIETVNKEGVPMHVGCSCLYFNASRKLVKCEVGDEVFEHDLRKKTDSDSVRSLYGLIERKCDFHGEMLQQHVSDTEMAEGEYLPVESLSSGPKVPLILDIDEDFFGVTTLRDAELVMGALPKKESSSIARVLEKLRARSVEDEDLLNTALRRDAVLHWKMCWHGPRATPACDRGTPVLSLPTRELLSLLHCSERGVETLDENLGRLVRSSPNAAHLIAAHGFCLFTSPSTFRDRSGGYRGDGTNLVSQGFKWCGDLPSQHAAVHNDDSEVTRAVNDSPHEIARRLRVLRNALRREPQVPVLVTICRSIRDGYAASRHWKQIEAGVLALLAERYPDFDLDVEYDKNLLGGAEGWTNHARPIDYE